MWIGSKAGHIAMTNRGQAGPRGACTGLGRNTPRHEPRAEVSLLPRGQDDFAIHLVEVRESERERRRAADDLAGGGVLRAVARADVLELGAVPWDDAAEVGA